LEKAGAVIAAFRTIRVKKAGAQIAEERSKATNPAEQQTLMKYIVAQTIGLHLLAATLLGQNPPLSGNPYAPRGEPKSPDGIYEWIVKTNPTIRYELINIGSKTAVASVDCYYPDPNEMNIRYANAFGVFWNEASSVVALDELNRRRAGHLYFFTLTEGKVREYQVEQVIPIPKTADEARFVVDSGWISPTKIRVRLAVKSRGTGPTSKFYIVDFSNPDTPKVIGTH
jgi:hypothetical protein